MLSSAKDNNPTITTRLPLGTLFDSRDYIFCTRTNVRGYEWTREETENLWQDLLDFSMEADEIPGEFELSQIILVPMEWDRQSYGLGARYDLYDGQQRLVTLCLLLASLRDSLVADAEAGDGDVDAVAKEISNMLHPVRARKDDISRVELRPRDDIVLQSILRGEASSSSLSIGKSVTHQRLWQNSQFLRERASALTKEERINFLDFILERVYMLVCVSETPRIARNIVMGQNKGMNNEPIDDFKGLVCFRYTNEEEDMYHVFDAWDNLAATPPDLENNSVGRKTVVDACTWRATVALETKIRTRDPVQAYEMWLRSKKLKTGREFFEQCVQPASIILGRFRTDNMPFLKNRPSLTTRLTFLRKLIECNSSAKESEMVILELLTRATSKNEDRMSLSKLDDNLHAVELTALWMALAKPSATQRYNRWFDFLRNVEEESPIGLSEEEKYFIKLEIQIMDIGATTSGKKLAGALLARMQNNENDDSLFEVEHVLPVKRHNASWKKMISEPEEREQYMHKFGNLVLVSKKPTTRESNQSFDDKKKRYDSSVNQRWKITQKISSISEWNKDIILDQQLEYVNVMNNIWGL